MLPIIEIVDQSIGIEKDGIIGTIQPFETKNVVFVPKGKLGTIKNALSLEQMQPIKHIDYASYNNALISKWQENDPWSEFTGVELNAFPSFESIDNVYILTAIA